MIATQTVHIPIKHFHKHPFVKSVELLGISPYSQPAYKTIPAPDWLFHQHSSRGTFMCFMLAWVPPTFCLLVVFLIISYVLYPLPT